MNIQMIEQVDTRMKELMLHAYHKSLRTFISWIEIEIYIGANLHK